MLDHWTAAIAEPFVSVVFASVSKSLDGTWKVIFTPRGRGSDEPWRYIGPYRTREKAMAHVERWARAHWATVPRWSHPLSSKWQSFDR